MQNAITINDWLLFPVYLVIMLMIAVIYRGKLQNKQDRKYFMWGLYASFFGGIAFALIYVYYYKGGDTVNYWHSANCLINLAGDDFQAFWKIMWGNMNPKYLSAFTQDTGYPLYRHDPNSFSTVRYLVPFVFMGAKKFLISTLVLNFLLYFILFRFYRFIRGLYPQQQKITAIAFLFIPSVVFWSSGLFKDSLTFSFALLSIISIYHLIIKPEKRIRYFFYLLFAAYILLNVKPYIFYAVLAAALIWFMIEQSKRIKSGFLKFLLMPIIVVIIFGGGLFAFSQLGNLVGGYYSDMDVMAERASVIQEDLSREYYGENTFDIGDWEPTIGGMLSKFPQAVIAGLYRPFIWDGTTIFMILSGLENLILLLLSLYILLRIGPIRFFRHLSKDPFLSFCFIFAVIMSFFIGLATANFGALVRYRIPLLPFFIFALLTIYFKYRKHKKAKNL
ncbi:MAG: hypothetical protein ACQES1_01395 [Bacteroidota bacterium]